MCPGESVLNAKVDHCYKVFITACSALAFPIGCMHIFPKEMRRFWEQKFSNKIFSVFQVPPFKSPKPDTMQLQRAFPVLLYLTDPKLNENWRNTVTGTK